MMDKLSTKSLQNLLSKNWKELYKRQDHKIIKGSIDELSIKKVGDHYLLLNPARKIKHNMSQDVSKKEVSIPFNNNVFNFCQIQPEQKIFDLDLKSISKSNSVQQIDKNGEKQAEYKNYWVLVNISPIFSQHCLLIPYPQQKLPQILTPQIVGDVMKIFNVMPQINVAFNSIGAAASINHLHFHIFQSFNIVGCESLPIESFPKQKWLKLSEKNSGILVEQIDHKGTYAFLFNLTNLSDKVLSDFVTLLSPFFEGLIQLNLPHNLLICQKGLKIYLLVRDFDRFMGWIEFSGVLVCIQPIDLSEEQIVAKKQKLTKHEQFKQKIEKLKSRLDKIYNVNNI